MLLRVCMPSQMPAAPPAAAHLNNGSAYTRLLLSLSQPEGNDTGLNVPSPPGRPSPSAITRVYQASYAQAVRQRLLVLRSNTLRASATAP